MKKLKCTYYSEDFPKGFVTYFDVSGRLEDIYSLLANGRNIKLTLLKDDNERAEYELLKEVDNDTSN